MLQRIRAFVQPGYGLFNLDFSQPYDLIGCDQCG